MPAATWTEEWEDESLGLYDGLTKLEASAVFVMRTEIMGLRSWLASIHVSGITPECDCGWRHQTLVHVFDFCAKYDRSSFQAESGTTSIRRALTTKKGCKAAAEWMLTNNILPYMSMAYNALKEDRSGYATAPRLEGRVE